MSGLYIPFVFLTLFNALILGKSENELMVNKINAIRHSGCYCGGEKMGSVKDVSWNEKLFISAYTHAKDMNDKKYFSHVSKSGENVGKRVDKVGYQWQMVGENIAEGQKNFDEALVDWLKSPSHCKMIMEPGVNEMAVAHSGKYWVQHFGKRKSGRKP